MASSNNTPKIYVADLASYNEGKLIGEWLDLSDYNSGGDVMDAIQGLLDKWSEEQGEVREEYAIHDAEYIPNNLYSEYMGESTFDKIIEIKNVAEEINAPTEVISDWMSETGNDDPSSASSAFQGKYDDEEDFAYRMVEDIGISGFTDFEYYLDISETDRRLLSQETADSYVDDIRDEDRGNRLIEEADLDLDEYTEADSDRQEEMLDEAREIVYDRIYDDWYDGLSDPFHFLVNEQGIYDSESLSKASFIMIDYEKLADALSQDYSFISGDDGVYVFNRNYKQGGAVRHSKKLDKKRKALHGGKRESASGNIYYEYRKNHSDNDRRVRLKDGGGVGKRKKTDEELYEEEQQKLMFDSEYANGGGVGSPTKTPETAIEQMIANANHEKYVYYIIHSLEENGYTHSEATETCKKFDKEIIEYKKQLMYPSDVANELGSKELDYANGGGVGEDISKSLYVAELYDNDGNIMGYTVRDKFNVSGKYTLSSKKERAEENRQYLIDNPSRLAYYRKNEYAKGGGVKHSKKLDKKRKAKPEGWRYKTSNKDNPKYYKRPTSEEIQKKSKRIYLERRKSKSDNNQSKKI